MAEHSDGRGYSTGASHARRASARTASGDSRTTRRSSYGGAGRRAPSGWTRGEEPIRYGRRGTYTVKPAPQRSLLLIVALTLFACIVVIFAIVNLVNAASNKTGTNVHDAAAKLNAAGSIEHAVADLAPELEEIVNASYTVEAADMLAIPGSDEVIKFDSANRTSTPVGDSDAIAAVRSAVASIEENGDCGFVFVDMNTGVALAYNADEVLYVASAAKAPFIYWLLMSGVEYGEYDWDNIAWTIEDSENEAFDTLFYEYYNDGYAEMMADHGVQHEDYYGDFYPKMSARSLASLWVDMLRYTQSGAEDANWLIALLGRTTTSFIRDALYDVDATVVNKAGWIAEDGYVSVTDAGVIQSGDNSYLMVIVTSQPDADETEQNVTTLARTLYDARSVMRG